MHAACTAVLSVSARTQQRARAEELRKIVRGIPPAGNGSNLPLMEVGMESIQDLRAWPSAKLQLGNISRSARQRIIELPVGSLNCGNFCGDLLRLMQGAHMQPTKKQITIGKAVFKALP